MYDLISRQVAIRKYQEVCNEIKCGECPFLIKVNVEKGSHLITDCKLEAFLYNLPSAQPEQKTGTWIKEPNCYYRCSECGDHYPSIRGYMAYNFCPNCGAYNREVTT